MQHSYKTADAAESAFYEAFRQLDSGRMQRLWQRSENVYCIHPGGTLILGFTAVMDSWRKIFSGAQAATLDFRLVQRYSDSHYQLHLVEERIGNGQETAVVMATNIYCDAGQGWEMTAHHATILPGQAETTQRLSSLH